MGAGAGGTVTLLEGEAEGQNLSLSQDSESLLEIYDISQTIREGIVVWPGDQEFRRRWTMQLREGDLCNVSAVTMSIHTGTHLDAPCHIEESGSDIAAVPLRHCIGPARVVSMDGAECITRTELERLNWEGVERVLFKTRSSNLPEDQFDPEFAYLSEDGADFLGRRALLLVGIDTPSVDPYTSQSLRSHKVLLSHRVAILEGTRLAQVPEGDFDLVCLPLKLAGLDGSPVRAILIR
jgi:arylformamidase